jgi:hypothetical protein
LGPLRTLRQFCKEQAAQHAALTHLASVQLKNHLLWVNLVAVVISVSGLRRWLDPASPAAVPGLAWVAGTLDWYSRCTMALLLFSNGAWMHGKQLLKDNLREVRGGTQVTVYSIYLFLLFSFACYLFLSQGGVWLPGQGYQGWEGEGSGNGTAVQPDTLGELPWGWCLVGGGGTVSPGRWTA